VIHSKLGDIQLRRWTLISKPKFITLIFLPILTYCLCSCSFDNNPILIASVASNATDAFKEIGTQFETATGTKVSFNFSSSGKLTQQIINGAPVDFFASANKEYIDELNQKGLIDPTTETIFAKGRLTLWMPVKIGDKVNNIKDLLLPEIKIIAIANPDHAPYGIAAIESLKSSGIWDKVNSKIIIGENVNQTMQYGTSGNADVVIVPLSLSIIEPEGKYLIIKGDLHNDIEQSMAIIKNSQNKQKALKLLDFILSDAGKTILEKFGYYIPP